MKPERPLGSISAGALRLLSLRSSPSKSYPVSPSSEGCIRRLSVESMSRAVRALDTRTDTLRSDNSVPDDKVADRGTMVVVICNFGPTVESSDAGTTAQPLAEVGVDILGGDIGRGRIGICSLLVPIGKDGFTGESMSTSVGIGARGGAPECDSRKAGSRIEALSGRGGGDTCPCELKRALIWSSDGMGLLGLESLARNAWTADLLSDLDCMSLGSRKSTCSTQGSTELKPMSAKLSSVSASNRARGELRPGEGRV